MGTRRVEWIGAKSPLQNDAVMFRKMVGHYTDDIEVALEAIAWTVSGLIRQHGTTKRTKGPADGLSKHYAWGPRHFVTDMEEIDVERLLRHPDGDEFKDLDNPDHDDREPQVPWYFLTAKIERIIREAENGPQLVLASQRRAKTGEEADSMLQEYDDRRKEAKERSDWYHEKGMGRKR